MQIEVSSDGNIEGGDRRIAHVRNVVEAALARFSARVTRVEVHLTDVIRDKTRQKTGHKNGQKNGQKNDQKNDNGNDDAKCVMEVRLQGRPPLAVTSLEASLKAAVGAAAGKLTRLVETTLWRERSLAGQREHR